MPMTQTFIGWHKYCSGEVFRVEIDSNGTGSYYKCTLCGSTSIAGNLGPADTVTDENDASVSTLLAARITNGAAAIMKYF